MRFVHDFVAFRSTLRPRVALSVFYTADIGITKQQTTFQNA